MACNNGHPECFGPECTKNSSPKRALQGAAKDKAAIMAALKEVCNYFAKESATSVTVCYGRLESALRFIDKAKDIIRQQSSWQWSVSLHTAKEGCSDVLVRIRLIKAKV